MLENGNTSKTIKNGIAIHGVGTSTACYGVGLHGSRTEGDACLFLFYERLPDRDSVRLYLEAYIQVDRHRNINYNTGW